MYGLTKKRWRAVPGISLQKNGKIFFAVEIDKTKALCYNANVRDKGGSVRVSRSIV